MCSGTITGRMLGALEAATARRRLRHRDAGRDSASLPDPGRPPGTDCLPRVRHTVLMMENHSFDKYFGTLGHGDGLRPGPDGTWGPGNPTLAGDEVRPARLASTEQVSGYSAYLGRQLSDDVGCLVSGDGGYQPRLTKSAVARATESLDWAGRPVAVLLVDALHDYASVSRDFSTLADDIVGGGLVAFHDCADYYPGVQAFVSELQAMPGWLLITAVGTLVPFQRTTRQATPVTLRSRPTAVSAAPMRDTIHDGVAEVTARRSTKMTCALPSGGPAEPRDRVHFALRDVVMDFGIGGDFPGVVALVDEPVASGSYRVAGWAKSLIVLRCPAVGGSSTDRGPGA